MALRCIVFACVQILCLQSAYSSCVPNAVTETCVQSPVLVNQPSILAQPTIVAQPNYLAPCEIDFVSQYAVPALSALPVAGATIIQDGSVANNLANALQLLIVSNLLSNTLPTTDILNLGVQPALQFAQPALQFPQPALQVAQPALQIAQPALQIAPPVLQLAQPALQYVSGCGCGCGCGGCGCGSCGCGGGCGCGGLNFVF